MIHRPRSPSARAGAVVLAAVVAVAVLAPWIAGDPLRPALERGLDRAGAPLPPSAQWPLGTDALGRDVWARLAHGARASLAVVGLATAAAAALGTAVGGLAGSRGGALDRVLMRGVDVALAVPALLVAAVGAAALRRAGVDGDRALILTLAGLGWPPFARVVRAEVAALGRRDYVLAARTLGASPMRIAVRHVGPALAPLLAALTAIALAHNLIVEAGLGYLGLGAPPPAPTWGRMLAEGQPYLDAAPWLVVAPGLAIALTVTACNLLGKGLHDGRTHA